MKVINSAIAMLAGLVLLSTHPLPVSSSISQDRIELLCRSVDQAISGVEIQAVMILEMTKEGLQDFWDNPEGGDGEKRIATGPVRQKRDLEMSLIEGVMCVKGQVEASPLNAEPFQTRKVWHLGKEEREFFPSPTGRRSVVIHEQRSFPCSFRQPTIFSFGRGLTRYVSYPLEIAELEEARGNYRLTAWWDREQTRRKASLVLDSSKGFCWTSAQIYDRQGRPIIVGHASDFRTVDQVTLPFRCVIRNYAYHRETGHKILYSTYEMSISHLNIIADENEAAARLSAMNQIRSGDYVMRVER